jgi:geranylgeranyl pyrophosphate synthase
VTGKAAGNDVLRKKKSLPMLHALNYPGVGAEFGALLSGEVNAGKLPAALALLDAADARAFAITAAEAHYATGMAALDQALGPQTASSRLRAVAEWLLQRNA